MVVAAETAGKTASGPGLVVDCPQAARVSMRSARAGNNDLLIRIFGVVGRSGDT